ncbi:hypothetical protein C0992_010183 [Termitomyces sp. T32_za158]|nr:hypothetical protein C0992_010183 [Termitomyces sp. T32_za158]
MSSTTSTSSASTQLPSIGTSGNNGTSRSASYFFGFLVTFAVLLVLFVVAGFLSRHRMRARRRAATPESGIGAGDPWVYGYRERRLYEEARRVRPVYMERWYEDLDTNGEKASQASVGGRSGRWQDMTPLSVTLTRPERGLKPNEGNVEDDKTRRSSSSTISSWLSSLNTVKETDVVHVVEPPSPHLPTQDALHDPDAGVDVVVMIAMPRSPGTRGYEFGVANAPIVGQGVSANINSSISK